MIQFLHSEKEMLARLLVNMLDSTKLNLDKEKPMLGTIFHKLGEYRDASGEKVFSEEGLRTIFHVQMRNVLGHDSWWFDKKGRFCYPEEEPYNFGDFAGELVATSIIMEALNVKYLKKFFPESLDQVMNIISGNSSE